MDMEAGHNLAYIELGKFVYNFEGALHDFKNCINHIMHMNGLREENYSNILLANLTAAPIISVFQSIIPLYFKSSDQEFLNKIVTKFRDLIQIRNIVIHSRWIIGVGTPDIKETHLFGIKYRANKDGLDYYNLNLNIEKFKDINEIVKEFTEVVYEIWKQIEINEYDFNTLLKKRMQEIDLKKIISLFKESNS